MPIQPTSKHQSMQVDTRSGEVLPVMEIYPTIQGEGYHSGVPATFVRLQGCDVGCGWCDVKASWELRTDAFMPVSAIVSEISSGSCVVVTGGEPAMWDLSALCDTLARHKCQLHIETSGVYPITGRWHWVCLSPKRVKEPRQDALDQCNELKVVISTKHDLDYALAMRERVPAATRLYLQPEWSRRDKILPTIVAFIQNRPEWRLSLQTHKYIGIE